MVLEEVVQKSRASIEKEDLRILLPIVAKISPKVIVEIGMHQGFSMEMWRDAFDPLTLIGVEKNQPTPISYTQEVGMLWGHDSQDESTLLTVKTMLGYKGVDFLFIDGDHSLEGVGEDFDAYATLVKKGGIIAFHDAVYHQDKTEEVDLLWNKVKNLYNYVEIKASRNSTGIGMIFL